MLISKYVTALMQVNYTVDAFATLSSLVNFIEANNTQGAGIRWLQRYEKFLLKALTNAKRIRLCHNATFKKLNLKCINYNDWTIAFSIRENFILIEALLHKSRISN